jgi:hypothetical protein
MLGSMDKAQIAQALFLNPLNEGLDLVRRYQEGDGFRAYVKERMPLLAPIGLLIAFTSLACAASTVLYLGGTRSVLVLFAMLLVPIILAGSFFVQAYVFAYWLESRALARALHRKPAHSGAIALQLRKAGIDMGTMPPVPWLLAILFLGLPFAMLFEVAPSFAALLVLLHIAAPLAFARLDR